MFRWRKKPAEKQNEDSLSKNQIMLEQAKLQYQMLQKQINPHFLYNTLDSIRSEALKSQEFVIAEMVERLSKSFRYCVSYNADFVRLSEEIKHIDDYFYIQKFRFGDRFSLEMKFENPDVLDYYIPRMILQPIIENSIFHGLETKLGGGKIELSVRFTEKKLYILISDNGRGMKKRDLEELNEKLRMGMVPDGVQRSKIAVLNINNRIRFCFGKEYGLSMRSLEGIGCQTEFVMPLVDDLELSKYLIE